jgi:hypothetical protein
MESTESNHTVTISTLSINHRTKFAVMISHGEHHTILPWEYDNFDDAETDAMNLMKCLIDKGFISKPSDLEPSFDFNEVKPP